MYEKDYLENIVRKFDRIPPQKKQIIQAASIMADAVLSGGKVYIYDREKALMVEANTRASGLAITSNYYDRNKKLTPKDVLILAAVEPDTPGDVEIARKVKGEGAKVIAIVSKMGASRKPLAEEGDVIIDNHSPESMGILSVQGQLQKREFCPTTGVMNDIIFWAVCAAFIDEMFARGKTPSVYSGVHVSGGMELYKRATERCEKLGY